MRNPKFKNFSAAELDAYNSRTQDEAEALLEEKDFREWCNENGEDPGNEDAWEQYQMIQQELSGEEMDDDDRGGWDHNMTKD